MSLQGPQSRAASPRWGAALLAVALLAASNTYAQVSHTPLVPLNPRPALQASPTASGKTSPKAAQATITPSRTPSISASKAQPAPSPQPKAPLRLTQPQPVVTPTKAKASPPAPKTVVSKAATPTKSSAEEPCYLLFKRIPGVSRSLCAQSALQASGRHSVRGKPLLVRDLPAPAGVAKPTRVLVIGAIHGDELSSVTLALHWLQLAQEIPANAHWRFIPGLNPDGILAKKPTRFNAHGVDLNRNFPTPDWERDARKYWEVKTKKDPRRWPGNAPLSEPESKYLMEEMAQFKPHLIVSIHAPYGMLDFDGPTIPPQKLGRLYLDQIGIYPGSLGNYAGIHRGMPVVTIELKHALQAPNTAETRQMWLDLVRWMSARGL